MPPSLLCEGRVYRWAEIENPPQPHLCRGMPIFSASTFFLHTQEITRRAKIFCIDVRAKPRGGDAADSPVKDGSKRRLQGNLFRQVAERKGPLLYALYSSEKQPLTAIDDNLPAAFLGVYMSRCNCYAYLLDECHLKFVVYFITFGKCFIPFLKTTIAL